MNSPKKDYTQTMHEEYLPGYDWEDLIENDIENDIPLDEQNIFNEDPNGQQDREQRDEY